MSDSKCENNDHDGIIQELTDADGALELETPEDGATVENPPNGGVRAWLVVLSCTCINLLLGMIIVLIRAALILDENRDGMSSDTGIDSETLEDVSEQFLNIAELYAPIAALVMILTGYRPTICIGASVVMVTLFFLSYLGDDDTEHFIKFLIYGPTAMGISFIQLGALIPILEYFTTKRLRALLLFRLVTYAGQLLLLGFFFIPKLEFEWRICLRANSVLSIGIGLIGLTIKELCLKLKEDESISFVQSTLGLAKKEILRDLLLWLTCVVYLFYQWGIEPAQALFTNPEVAQVLDFDGSLAKALLFTFSQTIGLAVGIFLAWLFKKVVLKDNSREGSDKYDLWNFVLAILMVNAFTMGIACFVAPHAVNFDYFFIFSLIYGAFFAFCEAIRDDVIPVQFGRDTIRIVEGLVIMSAGLGGLITNAISDKIKDDDDDEGWKNVFRYGGGMLMFSAGVTALVYYMKASNCLEQIRSKINGNSVSPQQTTKENKPAVTPSNKSYRHNSNQRRTRQSVSGVQTIQNGSAEHSPYQIRQENEPVTIYEL